MKGMDSPTSAKDAPQSVRFTCLACRKQDGRPWLLSCRDLYLGTPYVVDFWRCDNCGLTQQWPLPAETSVLYLEYPVHKKKGSFYEALRTRLMAPSYFRLGKGSSDLRLLDFGCGDGWFLAGCRGKVAELCGFEPSSGHASRLSHALGIPILSDKTELLRTHALRFDIVTMHYVVEHLTDIDSAFATAGAALRPGGSLFIAIPDLTSTEAKMFGRKWHGLDPPRHISFPTQSVMTCLAERHGFALASSRALPFAPGLAGSLATLVAGKFHPWLFVLFMPLALVINFTFPGSARGYLLKKRDARF